MCFMCFIILFVCFSTHKTKMIIMLYNIVLMFVADCILFDKPTTITSVVYTCCQCYLFYAQNEDHQYLYDIVLIFVADIIFLTKITRGFYNTESFAIFMNGSLLTFELKISMSLKASILFNTTFSMILIIAGRLLLFGDDRHAQWSLPLPKP